MPKGAQLAQPAENAAAASAGARAQRMRQKRRVYRARRNRRLSSAAAAQRAVQAVQAVLKRLHAATAGAGGLGARGRASNRTLLDAFRYRASSRRRTKSGSFASHSRVTLGLRDWNNFKLQRHQTRVSTGTRQANSAQRHAHLVNQPPTLIDVSIAVPGLPGRRGMRCSGRQSSGRLPI